MRKVSGGINSGQRRARLQLGEVNEVGVLDRACRLIGTRRGRNGHIHILKGLKYAMNEIYIFSKRLSFNRLITCGKFGNEDDHE